MIWNFAYGSNLHPDRVAARADVEATRVVRATLPGWRLAFNLATGLGPVEPSMASIVPSDDETVHGIAIEMTPECFAALVRSEGGENFYRCVPFEAQTYDGARLEVMAFVACEEVVRSETPPSTRYLALLREGARFHDLDADYCDWLDAHPATPPHWLSPWVPRLFRFLDDPRLRLLRDLFLWSIKYAARLQATLTRGKH